MRREGFALGIAAALVALGAACSDDEKEKTAGEIASEENARLLCDRFFSCCTPAELDALPFVDTKKPPTREGCIAFHIATAHDYVVATDAEEAAGRVALHVGESEACVEELRAGTCADFHAKLLRLHVGDAYALCNARVVEPLVPEGEPCRFYLDCKEGWCDLPQHAAKGADAGPEPLGTCKPLPRKDEPCTLEGCAEGFFCDVDTSTCAPYVAEGSECTSDEACLSGACRGGSCVSPGRCGG